MDRSDFESGTTRLGLIMDPERRTRDMQNTSQRGLAPEPGATCDITCDYGKPSRRLWQYALAEMRFCVPLPLPGARPYLLGEIGRPEHLPKRIQENGDAPSVVKTVDGWIGNRWREIGVRSFGSGTELQVPGAGRFRLYAGRVDVEIQLEAQIDPAFLEEVLLGPIFLLTSAHRETYSLHASSLLSGGGAYAFVGESGKGKSTLAAVLGADPGGTLKRVSDDILPVKLESDGPVVLPHFPQLKLPAESQYAVTSPSRLPLRALFVLDPRADVDGSGIDCQPLAGRSLAQSLVRHSVASRLFPPTRLAKHLAFCAALAGHIKGYRLSYPKRLAVLPELRALVSGLSEDSADGG